MRNCPHCGKEIQNEAIFCRFCRREVEAPSWLNSLQKCPYCAEWVERGLESCPLCGQPLPTYKESKTPPFTVMQPDDLIAKLRVQADEEEEPEPQSSFLDRLRGVGPREEELPDDRIMEPETPPREFVEHAFPQEDEAAWEEDVIPPGFHSIEAENGKGISIPFDFGRALRYLLLLIILGGSVAGIAYLMRGPARPLISNILTPAPTETATQTPEPTATLLAATLPPLEGESSPSPDSTSVATSPNECLHWDAITVQDEGSELCVYGEIRRWFSAENIPFFAIFSEETGTFAFVDYNRTYSDIKPGVCIQDTGYIEVSPGGRPFLDLRGEFKYCEGQPEPTTEP
jgi:hypothetical protein